MLRCGDYATSDNEDELANFEVQADAALGFAAVAADDEGAGGLHGRWHLLVSGGGGGQGELRVGGRQGGLIFAEFSDGNSAAFGGVDGSHGFDAEDADAGVVSAAVEDGEGGHVNDAQQQDDDSDDCAAAAW